MSSQISLGLILLASLILHCRADLSSECGEESGLSDDQLQAFLSDSNRFKNNQDNESLKCYLKCVFEKTHHEKFLPDGRRRRRRQHSREVRKIGNKVIGECKDQLRNYESKTCDAAFELAKCMEGVKNRSD